MTLPRSVWGRRLPGGGLAVPRTDPVALALAPETPEDIVQLSAAALENAGYRAAFACVCCPRVEMAYVQAQSPHETHTGAVALLRARPHQIVEVSPTAVLYGYTFATWHANDPAWRNELDIHRRIAPSAAIDPDDGALLRIEFDPTLRVAEIWRGASSPEEDSAVWHERVTILTGVMPWIW